jgi:hypothetical protein
MGSIKCVKMFVSRREKKKERRRSYKNVLIKSVDWIKLVQDMVR